MEFEFNNFRLLGSVNFTFGMFTPFTTCGTYRKGLQNNSTVTDKRMLILLDENYFSSSLRFEK